MGRRNSDSGRQAVIWFAVAYTVLIGAAAAAFVIAIATDHPQGPLTILGCTLGGLVIVIMLLNIRWEEPMEHLKYWLLARDRSDPTDEYRAARRRIKSREQLGENGPPTVESVRDAANHGGAWVPRSNATPQNSPAKRRPKQ